MREKFQRFMQGRYGADELSRVLNAVALVLLLISVFVRNGIIYWLAIALIIYETFRMFSKNVSRRYQENQHYLNYRYKVIAKIDKYKKRFQQRKIYRFYKCPQCRQTVRVPRGRGRICITCPKCRTEFVKKS